MLESNYVSLFVEMVLLILLFFLFLLQNLGAFVLYYSCLPKLLGR